MNKESNPNIIDNFTQRIKKFKDKAAEVDKKSTRIALARFVVFVGGAIAIYKGFQIDWLVALCIGIGVMVLFGLVVKWNQRVNREKRFCELQAEINNEEIRRINGDYTEFDSGEDFIDPAHSYSADLDIFGPSSLFQLISHAVTQNGRGRLADWFANFPSRDEILRRQTAIKELKEKLDWRQALEAAGRMFEDSGVSPQRLLDWLKEPPKLSKAHIALPIWGMVSSAIVITLSALEILPWFAVFPLMGVNLLIIRFVSKKYRGAYENVGNQTRLLESYAELLSRIEELPVEAELLKNAKDAVLAGDRSASKSIKQLASIHDKLEMKYAQFVYIILNAITFWDVIWVMRLDAWKEQNASYVPKWFDALGDFEALSSLAALQYARPHWTFPEISDADLNISGTGIGHPLIAESERVNNDMSMEGKGTVWLITGSNMSGKSTFLRTAGINLVLGLTGAPVCAESFTCTPTRVFTSMRTQDSLEDHTSAFFAELKRLKQVIESVEAEPSVLFLLDEILKGTNSRDRHKGAKALILQLNRLGGAGMVSTHDLELGRLESTGFLKNYSFNSGVTEDNQLFFDYKLTKGLCHSFNASKLMRNMGIEVEEDPHEATPSIA